MYDKIGKAVHQDLTGIRSLGAAVESVPLDTPVIQAIGERFSADYVVRGRITVFETDLERWPFPLPEHALAFYFPEPGQKTPFLGVASIGTYEFFNGRPIPPPRDTIRSEDNRQVVTSNQRLSPIVRLDLFIHDGKSGNLLFVNSSEVRSAEIKTVNMLGHSHGHELADRAVRLGADKLIDPLM
jgi:hypothetical protein